MVKHFVYNVILQEKTLLLLNNFWYLEKKLLMNTGSWTLVLQSSLVTN